MLIWSEISLVAMTGLLSAPHCMGMCGGVVSAVSLQTKVTSLQAILLYNSGRAAAYILLGAAMGAVGSFVDLAGRLSGIQGMASIIGGLFILLWLWRRFQLPWLSKWSSVLHRSMLGGKRQGGGRRSEVLHVVATGFAFGFLPCGLTYAMQMKAAASGHVWTGAAIMGLFALATFPALAAVGLLAGRLGKTWRRSLNRLGTWVAVLVGVLAILRGLAASGVIPTISPWLW